jgi:transposase
MTTEILTMSQKELDRAELIRRVHERRLTQRKAAEILGLTERQVQRLYRAYRSRGPAALISRKRGQPSNRRLPDELQTPVLQLVRSRYADFGPTLAREKLVELHDLEVSVETLRKWMIAGGLWTPRKQRNRCVQQPRRRRDCLGELVQIDGSDHQWFEQRAERCVLLVYIDDATGSLMELHFCRSESTFEYFFCTRRYLLTYGKPVAFYSDKASIFRVNKKQPQGGDGLTQFGRAMTDLNVDIICANTPAAKGRVERVNLTLQDRLVKELRLQDISTIAEANRFLPRFREDFNQRFARQPNNSYDAHRPLLPTDDLDDVFTWQEQRRVSKSLTLNYKNVMYLLEPTDRARELIGNLVTVYETENGHVSIRQGALTLPATAFPRQQARVTQGAIAENKLLGAVLSEIRYRQLARDETALKSKKVTLREKERIRHAMQAALR